MRIHDHLHKTKQSPVLHQWWHPETQVDKIKNLGQRRRPGFRCKGQIATVANPMLCGTLRQLRQRNCHGPWDQNKHPVQTTYRIGSCKRTRGTHSHKNHHTATHTTAYHNSLLPRRVPEWKVFFPHAANPTAHPAAVAAHGPTVPLSASIPTGICRKHWYILIRIEFAAI